MSRPSLLDKLRGMNQRSLFGPGKGRMTAASSEAEAAENEISVAGQARTEAVQRLQVGLFGIGAMVLLVGLASVIGGQADLADEMAVPEAAPTTEPAPIATGSNPLADAGVVPDIADESSDELLALPSPTVQRDGSPAQ